MALMQPLTLQPLTIVNQGHYLNEQTFQGNLLLNNAT